MPAWNFGVVDLETDISTVTPAAALVKGFYVNTVLSAHAVVIKNGTTAVFTIEANKAAGSLVDFAGTDGVIFDTSVIVDPDNSSTGNITVIYRDR